MEIIVNNPGLQHLAENILLNLDHHDLEICQGVNTSFKKILDNPRFWLRKFIRRGQSKKNQSDWINAIQITKDTELEKPLISFLKKCSKNPRVIDPPCYIDEEFLATFNELRYLADKANDDQSIDDTGRSPIFQAVIAQNLVEVKILALFADNPNAPDKKGLRPIHVAARYCYKGDEEIVRILAPLTDNPNALTTNGENVPPILLAAVHGHTEIVKILAPLTENPNAPNYKGNKPIYFAAGNGYEEIVRILAPLTDDPNAPDELETTPIFIATYNGHEEIVKFLAPLTDNPNAPNKNGTTPIQIAVFKGHNGIVQILESIKPNNTDRLKGLQKT